MELAAEEVDRLVRSSAAGAAGYAGLNVDMSEAGVATSVTELLRWIGVLRAMVVAETGERHEAVIERAAVTIAQLRALPETAGN